MGRDPTAVGCFVQLLYFEFFFFWKITVRCDGRRARRLVRKTGHQTGEHGVHGDVGLLAEDLVPQHEQPAIVRRQKKRNEVKKTSRQRKKNSLDLVSTLTTENDQFFLREMNPSNVVRFFFHQVHLRAAVSRLTMPNRTEWTTLEGSKWPIKVHCVRRWKFHIFSAY